MPRLGPVRPGLVAPLRLGGVAAGANNGGGGNGNASGQTAGTAAHSMVGSASAPTLPALGGVTGMPLALHAVMGFQDEFMQNAADFSLSWREEVREMPLH